MYTPLSPSLSLSLSLSLSASASASAYASADKRDSKDHLCSHGTHDQAVKAKLQLSSA